MASSNKTAFLSLNDWAAADKPKRDDFNNDNRLIDSGMQMLSQGLDALSTLSESVSETVGALAGDIEAHTENADAHCTAAEKALWSNPPANQNTELVFGTFDGDSASTRKIALGYAPKSVLVFPVNTPLFEAIFSSGVLYVYSAAGIQNSASKGLRLETDGFTVVYNMAVNAGVSLRTNQSGITYGYIVCK
jgi:hypothetical protein